LVTSIRSSQQKIRSAFLDARIAALKAGVRLTPSQEATWPAFEQAVRNMAIGSPRQAPGPTVA
jgi:hypothetical protein